LSPNPSSNTPSSSTSSPTSTSSPFSNSLFGGSSPQLISPSRAQQTSLLRSPDRSMLQHAMSQHFPIRSPRILSPSHRSPSTRFPSNRSPSGFSVPTSPSKTCVLTPRETRRLPSPHHLQNSRMVATTNSSASVNRIDSTNSVSFSVSTNENEISDLYDATRRRSASIELPQLVSKSAGSVRKKKNEGSWISKKSLAKIQWNDHVERHNSLSPASQPSISSGIFISRTNSDLVSIDFSELSTIERLSIPVQAFDYRTFEKSLTFHILEV
jgi:hypothetical protein